MSIQYDKSVIQKFAQTLYNKADSLQMVMGFIGGFIGAIVGGMSGVGVIAVILCGLIGIALGYYIGSSMGLNYRIEAQKALCLAQIEENTRNGAVQQERKPEPVDRFNVLETVKGAER
jgi:VIT1/CCC1 family predicted Fe2+/Mn2+ transporter